MAVSKRKPFKLNIISKRCLHKSKIQSPGDTLLKVIKAKGISQKLLAETINRPIKTVNEIVKAKARLTENTALDLEHALGIPAHIWMALEAAYRINIARLNRKPNVIKKLKCI